MTDISRADAKELAVEYAAYTRAVARYDHLGTLVWGRMILETQARLGVDLVNVETTTSVIKNSRKVRKATDAARAPSKAA